MRKSKWESNQRDIMIWKNTNTTNMKNKEKRRATPDPAQILRQDHNVLRLHLPKLSQLNGVLDFSADEYSEKKTARKSRVKEKKFKEETRNGQELVKKQ